MITAAHVAPTAAVSAVSELLAAKGMKVAHMAWRLHHDTEQVTFDGHGPFHFAINRHGVLVVHYDNGRDRHFANDAAGYKKAAASILRTVKDAKEKDAASAKSWAEYDSNRKIDRGLADVVAPGVTTFTCNGAVQVELNVDVPTAGARAFLADLQAIMAKHGLIKAAEPCSVDHVS